MKNPKYLNVNVTIDPMEFGDFHSDFTGLSRQRD